MERPLLTSVSAIQPLVCAITAMVNPGDETLPRSNSVPNGVILIKHNLVDAADDTDPRRQALDIVALVIIDIS